MEQRLLSEQQPSILKIKKGQHVMKSDVKSYYASIDHDILFNLLPELSDFILYIIVAAGLSLRFSSSDGSV